MVLIQPVKSLVPVDEVERLSAARVGAPNRFRSQSYDRSVFGPDDCTRQSGNCKCHMCCDTPLVIVPSGNPICNHYNITLRNVQEFLDGGLLKPLHEESFMIYCQVKLDGTSQVGVFAAIDAADCMSRVVRPHENVTSNFDKSHANLKKATHPYMNPVMLFHRDSESLNAVIERIMQRDEPFQKIASADCVESHKLWMVNEVQDIEAIKQAFASIDHLYIADGHHRTAAICRESLRLSSGRAVNVAQSSRFLTALIFPDSQLSVLAYNRCVQAWPEGLTTQDLLDQVSRSFNVHAVMGDADYLSEHSDRKLSMSSGYSGYTSTESFSCSDSPVNLGICSPGASPSTSRSGSVFSGSYEHNAALTSDSPREDLFRMATCGRSAPTLASGESDVQQRQELQLEMQLEEQRRIHMYVDGQWYLLEARDSAEEVRGSNPLGGIGSQILMEQLLKPIMHVDDPNSENHMIYVDGREGKEGVEKLVDCGKAAVGFVLSAVPTAQIMRVADAGQLLPAKATFFDPKPMQNLLLRLLR